MNLERQIKDFIAIDFETAFTDKNSHICFPCQIGIAVVSNGIIVDKICRLIQPPHNKYDTLNISIHNIYPSHTENEPSFPVVWNDIRKFFENSVVIAHNMPFDRSVLLKTLEYYNLPTPNVIEWICTCHLTDNTPLSKACAQYGVPLTEHHDGLCDAVACANLFLAIQNGVEPTPEDELPLNKTSKAELDLFGNIIAKHKPLKGDQLKKDLSCADPNNPFYDRKVVITGLFPIDRTIMAAKLKNMGADLNSTISKKTNYVIIGDEAGPKKLEEVDKLIHNGYQIKKIFKEELLDILDGKKWDENRTDKEVKKDLVFSMEHFHKHHLPMNSHRNPFSGKELYLSNSLRGNRSIFNQMMGNLGAYGNYEYSSDINVFVISDFSLNNLNNGEKDTDISEIQEYYNSNKSVTFDWCFVSESEVLSFVERWCNEFNDDNTGYLYQRYLQTEKEG